MRFGYIKITILGFALSGLWSSMHLIIMPLRLLDFIPETQKNTWLDLLILTGLILGMMVQPIAGAISDRSSLSPGPRRPYILAGTIFAVLLILGIGFGGSYIAIFIIYCLLQISSNTAQGPFQAFIPDMVPEEKRGLASGVRGLLMLVGGVALIYTIAPLMDRYSAGEGRVWLWLSLALPGMVLLGAMLFTVLTVKEQPRPCSSQPPLLPTLYKSFKFDFRSNSDFLIFLFSSFLVFMGFYTLMSHALYYLKDVGGIRNPAGVMASFAIAVGICMAAIVYPAGRLSDSIGRRPVVVAAGLLGASGVLLFFFSQSYILLMFSGGLFGICGGAWTSSQWALATDLVGKGAEARELGLVNMSIAGAGAAARLIGPAIDFFNTCSPNLGYQIMLLSCFIYFTIGSLLLIKVKGCGSQEKKHGKNSA